MTSPTLSQFPHLVSFPLSVSTPPSTSNQHLSKLVNIHHIQTKEKIKHMAHVCAQGDILITGHHNSFLFSSSHTACWYKTKANL